jgi:ABC-type sugar transport system ATPase subunit
MITHNLNDIFEVADRLAVLYLGRTVAAGPASGFDRQNVVEYMTTGTATRPHADRSPDGAPSQETDK